MSNNTEIHFEDKKLVDRVLSGDTNAFDAIIKNTKRLVAQIVYKMINDAEDRKDLAQDIYIKVFRSLPGFKFQSKLSTWIARITYNTCLNHLEKGKLDKLPVFYEDTEAEDKDGYQVSSKSISLSSNEVETTFFQKELMGILQVEIDTLTPLYKTLISLYHNEEMSYEEIAQITDLPEGTVKNYLFRARKTLKNNLLSKYKREEL